MKAKSLWLSLCRNFHAARELSEIGVGKEGMTKVASGLVPVGIYLQSVPVNSVASSLVSSGHLTDFRSSMNHAIPIAH